MLLSGQEMCLAAFAIVSSIAALGVVHIRPTITIIIMVIVALSTLIIGGWWRLGCDGRRLRSNGGRLRCDHWGLGRDDDRRLGGNYRWTYSTPRWNWSIVIPRSGRRIDHRCKCSEAWRTQAIKIGNPVYIVRIQIGDLAHVDPAGHGGVHRLHIQPALAVPGKNGQWLSLQQHNQRRGGVGLEPAIEEAVEGSEKGRGSGIRQGVCGACRSRRTVTDRLCGNRANWQRRRRRRGWDASQKKQNQNKSQT